MTDILFFFVPFLCAKRVRVALVMNGVASQHSQPHSLLNTSTISGPAGIADHTSGAGFISTSNQQALQHSPHHDSTSPNDTSLTSDSPPPPDIEPLTTTAGVTEALVPKEQPPGDEVGEGQERVQDWIPDADHELKRVKVCQSFYSRYLSVKLLCIIMIPCSSMSKWYRLLSITHYSSSGVRTYWLTVDGSRDSVLLWPVSRRDE